VNKIDVDIGLHVQNGVSFFEVKIDFGLTLTKREEAILFNSARSCEVRKILSGKTEFHYQRINGDP